MGRPAKRGSRSALRWRERFDALPSMRLLDVPGQGQGSPATSRKSFRLSGSAVAGAVSPPLAAGFDMHGVAGVDNPSPGPGRSPQDAVNEHLQQIGLKPCFEAGPSFSWRQGRACPLSTRRANAPMTQSIAEHWGVLEGQRQLMGRPTHVPDAQIAATALERGLTVVTRNVKDFEGLGATLINPWYE